MNESLHYGRKTYVFRRSDPAALVRFLAHATLPQSAHQPETACRRPNSKSKNLQRLTNKTSEDLPNPGQNDILEGAGIFHMRWTEERLRTRIPAKIREERREEGLDPDVCPTREWLRDHGYGGIEGYARRNEKSVTEVLQDVCGFEPRGPKPLGINHPETRRLIDEWLQDEDEVFYQWEDGRINDARTHIRTLADVAREELGSSNFLRLVRETSEVEVNHLIRLFGALGNRLETEGAESNYTRTLERWADYLVLKGEIDAHKIENVRGMMGYTYERKSPEHYLDPEQIRECWRATETLEEQALLVVLAASGIRREEPTSRKVSDLRLDRDDPYIVFDDNRKTGAATVPLMAGVEVLEKWLDKLETLDYWDGEWLFPSKKSQDGSRPAGWVNDTIEEIVERADVTFPDGEQPTPKSFRDFWYNHYLSARQTWLTEVETLADEQGVSSAKIIDLHYLTAKGERDHFRKFAQSYFAAAFGDDLTHGIKGVHEVREEERDDDVQTAIDDYVDEIRAELEAASDEGDASEESDNSEFSSGAASDPVSAWTRARLRTEHAAAAASDQLAHYPPSPTRGTALVLGLALWAVFAGVVWGATGAFTIDPGTGSVMAKPGSVIGLALSVVFIVTDLPAFEDAE